MYQYFTLLDRAKTSWFEAYDIWLRMSAVSATMFILGLHQEKKVNEIVPLFMCELRTRLFEQVYEHDKVNPGTSHHFTESVC